MTLPGLTRSVLDTIEKGVVEPLSDEAFNELALEVFAFQCDSNSAYAAFAHRRGVTPGEVEYWHDVPFLPAQAFKSEVLVSGRADRVERVFRTSGTTGGPGSRGEHHVLDLSVYRASLMPNFVAHVSLDETPRPVLSLLPSPEEVPDSSLSYMMGEVTDRLGGPGSGFFVDGAGEMDVAGFRREVERATTAGEAVLLAGTAFSFVRLLEESKADLWAVTLPDGSVLMETGGYKGRSTALSRSEFYAGLERAFGLPQSRIVNEYGMTELLSQFYESVLTDDLAFGADGLHQRFHRGPPWVRSLVLDPLSLVPVGPGETGVLAHFDLANLGSVAPVLTEDLGQSLDGGFRLLGRNPGSEPRGCSLAMEDFLESQRGRL